MTGQVGRGLGTPPRQIVVDLNQIILSVLDEKSRVKAGTPSPRVPSDYLIEVFELLRWELGSLWNEENLTSPIFPLMDFPIAGRVARTLLFGLPRIVFKDADVELLAKFPFEEVEKIVEKVREKLIKIREESKKKLNSLVFEKLVDALAQLGGDVSDLVNLQIKNPERLEVDKGVLKALVTAKPDMSVVESRDKKKVWTVIYTFPGNEKITRVKVYGDNYPLNAIQQEIEWRKGQKLVVLPNYLLEEVFSDFLGKKVILSAVVDLRRMVVRDEGGTYYLIDVEKWDYRASGNIDELLEGEEISA